MNLFDKLVDEALRNQPKLAKPVDPDAVDLRLVVEKELLHHDIFKILSDNDMLQNLTFMGGTALRACYGAVRLSEDLDFTGGMDFSSESLSQMGKALKQGIYTKYGFTVEVSEPKKEKQVENNNVDTWEIKITTRPESRFLPLQRINIDICLLPSYEKRPMMLMNPYGVDTGTSGLILQVQSLEEIYTDKVIAFTLRKTIKYRDLWDILWLRQRGIVPNIRLLPLKLKDRKRDINEFLNILDERLKSLDTQAHKDGFISEMQRFLPSDQLHILSQPEILLTIERFIAENSFHIPLIKAAHNGDINLIKELIDLGIDANKQGSYDGKTALHWAAQFDGCSGYPHGVIKLLLEAGADVNIRDKQSHAPLYYAAENSNSLETIRNLSLRANESNIKDALNVARYGGAISDSRTEIIKYLSLHPKVHQPQLDLNNNMDDYKKTIERVERLYEKHIINLYDKPLTLKEFESEILELQDSDSLKKFRRLYQGRNSVKPQLTKADKDKQTFLDTEITKLDKEVIPAYYIMQYLHSRNDNVSTIQCASTKQNEKGYDAQLTLGTDLEKYIEFTRAVDDGEEDLGQNDKKDGAQEMSHTQLLRQDGIAWTGGRVDYIKELGYAQLFPRANVNLSTDKYPKMLLHAWKKKVSQNNKKKMSGQNYYHWLIITLPADFNEPEEFPETCAIFYQLINQKNDIGFERIFIVLENRREGQDSDSLIWDSKFSL